MLNKFYSFCYNPVVEYIDKTDPMPCTTYTAAVSLEEIVDWDNHEDALNLMWAVYGRDGEGIVTHIADCPDEESARTIVKALSKLKEGER